MVHTKPLNAQRNIALYSLPLNLLCWCLGFRKSCHILPNTCSFLLARTMCNPCHGRKAYFTPVHTYTSSGIDQRQEAQGMKAQIRFLGAFCILQYAHSSRVSLLPASYVCLLHFVQVQCSKTTGLSERIKHNIDNDQILGGSSFNMLIQVLVLTEG